MKLDIRGLRSGYGRLEVLHGIDLTVEHGELVTVIGANGAGKTTLLWTLSGLISPTEGSIRMGDEELAGKSAEKVAALGLAHCPENRLVFGSLSVDENLELGAWARRAKPAEIKEDRSKMLDLLPRLGKRLKQAAGTLSGGEQQMLAIARGLMARPKVFLLDEPSLGIAPMLVHEIFDTLMSLKGADLTMVLVEQNLHQALRIADRAYVFERGQVVLDGPAADMAKNPRVQHAYLGGGYDE